MDAQQLHDQEMLAKPDKLLEPGSRQRLEALLAKKSASSSASVQSSGLGPIERAMRNHPGLTREDALQMAEEFGF